jgi:Rho termination factor, N-terminal domain
MQQSMRLKALKSFRYATRQLQEGDEFDARNPRDYKVLLAVKQAEPVSDVSVMRRSSRPVRRAVAAKAESKTEQPDELAEKTVPQLREMAEEKGVELPSGYLRHEVLVDLLKEQSKDQ